MEQIIGTSSTLPGQPTVEKGETQKKKRTTIKSRSAANFYSFINNYEQGNVAVTKDVFINQRKIIEQNFIDKNMKFSVPYTSNGT